MVLFIKKKPTCWVKNHHPIASEKLNGITCSLRKEANAYLAKQLLSHCYIEIKWYPGANISLANKIIFPLLQ